MTRFDRPYAVPRAAGRAPLALDANEGPAVGRDVLARLAGELARGGADLLRRYPDVGELERAYARLVDTDPARVLATAGGDEALDRILRATLEPGDEVVVALPTFEMIERGVALASARVVGVPWPDGAFPTDAVLAACGRRTAAVVVVTPNNPTGAVATADDLARLAAGAPDARLVVDLAYTEYADDDLTRAALDLERAVCVRTLSKAWGLAGLRTGFALGDPAFLDELRAVGLPFSVASTSAALALRSLAIGGGALRAHVERVRGERAELFELLRSLGARPARSQANFVLARFADASSADAVWRSLARLGVAVRAFPGRAGLEDALRITCPGDAADFRRLGEALRAALAPVAEGGARR